MKAAIARDEWIIEGNYRAVRDMILLAEAILKGALIRNESRGAHYKPEHPERDDENFLKATIATFDPVSQSSQISFAPVDTGLDKTRPRTYGKAPLYGLLLTFGAAMVIEEAIRLIWGTRDYVLPTPQGISGGFIALDLIWSAYRFWAAGIAAFVIGLTWLLIEKTPYGAIIKAGAHDSEMVRALGIDLSKLRTAVFVLGTMLAAVAGIVLAPIWGIRPHMGVDAVVPAFLVIVLGGVGSFWGAVAAGLIVGMAVGLSGAYASEWSMLSMYLLLVAVVTVRARGLFGKKSILEA